MRNLLDATARRFPLIARPRPTCSPLHERVHALTELAGTAAKQSDSSMASTVYNQAALIASDVGDPATARTMCHQHATAYLHAAPLNAKAAVRALEPVVNLARLQLRAGQADEGRQHLATLFDAITTGRPVQIEEIALPADLVANAIDRREVRSWLWGVILADGTRALTAAGRWTEALAHIETHKGVGHRMLDGRQVAVLAALMSGNSLETSRLLADAVPREAWERAVIACLNVFCRLAAGQPVDTDLSSLVSTYLAHEAEPGLTVFDIRLGLTILDAVGYTEHATASRLVQDLAHRTREARDGYAARDVLAHPLSALLTERQIRECGDLVYACALNASGFEDDLYNALTAALRISDKVIRDSLASM